MSTITDGTSNTILIMEDAGRPNWYVLRRSQGTALPRPEGFGWTDPDGGAGSMDGTDNLTGAINNDSEPYRFHSSGMNVSLADGSVRFIAETISAATFAALVTPRGGEVIGSDF